MYSLVEQMFTFILASSGSDSLGGECISISGLKLHFSLLLDVYYDVGYSTISFMAA